MCIIIQELLKVGGFHSIENPFDSYLWLSENIVALTNASKSYNVSFDQCQYNLKSPGGLNCDYVKKRTKILSNIPSIISLYTTCPGTSSSHQHHSLGAHQGEREDSQSGCSGRTAPKIFVSSIGKNSSPSLFHRWPHEVLALLPASGSVWCRNLSLLEFSSPKPASSIRLCLCR